MTKNVLIALLVWALLAAAVRAGESSKNAIFDQLETRWNDAHRTGDLATLEKIWADDIVIFVPRMPPLRKEDAVAMWETVPVHFDDYRSEILGARRVGEIAIVHGKIDRVRDFGGRRAEERWYFTKLYAQRDGDWKVIAFHASEREE